jgi:hypothetical protein
MDAQQFFTLFARTMAHNPPPKQDSAMLKKLATIGITPGKKFNFNALPKDVQRDLHKAVGGAQLAIKQAVGSFHDLVHGWEIMRSDIGTYGTDYTRRALVAFIGIGANLPQDAVYPTTFVDSTGKPLEGNNNYIIHFAKNEIPPVNAFWSVTVYNNRSFLVSNTINRYALGDRDDLTFNKDGSLDIYLQHTAPDKAHLSNWLPTPQGPFNLTMRLYWPKESVLDGTWAPPGVRRV